jgi:hypothetical protein
MTAPTFTTELDQRLYDVVQGVMNRIRQERAIDYSDGSADAVAVRLALFEEGKRCGREECVKALEESRDMYLEQAASWLQQELTK